ncbi:MAG: type II secretion system protein [Armatimonadota bacterium]
MNKRAFSLLELVSIVIILSVLLAVCMPILANFQLQSKANSAKDSLRGFWKGIKLYQADNEEKLEFGLAKDMGLPPESSNFAAFVESYTGDHHHTWETKKKYLPCGATVGEGDGQGLGYMPEVRSDWLKEVLVRRNTTVLMYDKNCNPPGTRVMCQFCEKRSIGVTLGGIIRDNINSNWAVYDQAFYE